MNDMVRQVPPRMVPPRINEMQSFTPAVLSDEQYKQMVIMAAQQIKELTDAIEGLKQLMRPNYELSKVMLAQFLRDNPHAVVPAGVRSGEVFGEPLA